MLTSFDRAIDRLARQLSTSGRPATPFTWPAALFNVIVAAIIAIIGAATAAGGDALGWALVGGGTALCAAFGRVAYRAQRGDFED